MKKDAIQFLGISYSKLDNLLTEIISLNLYCDLALILQIVANKRKIKEHLFGEIAGFDVACKKLISKFEGRLKTDRLNKEEKLKISDNEHIFNAPAVIKAYKEALFVKRAGTDILDISTVFIDIFKALFCNHENHNRDIRFIKAYRLWEFTSDTIQEVVKIYQQVLNSKNSYKYAELVFLEKLFGLLTLNEILSKDFNKKELIYVTTGMGKMNTLGYSSMTRLIASKINYKNHHIYEDVITQYIHPLCLECITAILHDVITYLASIKIEKRETVVASLLNACSRNLVPFSRNDLLKSIESDYIMDAFKTLFELPDYKTEQEKDEKFEAYLTSLKGSYSYSDNIEGENKTVTVVNDVNYESLSYTQDIAYTDDYLPTTEDDLKIYRRQKYRLV